MLAAPASLAHSSNEFLDLIDTTKKSVVFIINTLIEGTEPAAPAKPFTEPEQPDNLKPKGTQGSGFIVEGGYIVTNWHVIENAEKIEVFFEDIQKLYTVSVLGFDKLIDIAVLKPGEDFPKNIPSLEWRSKLSPLRTGEEVFAIGHPMGFSFSVTKGIISHLDRRIANPWQPTIQTDAAINQGSSGGPLLDMDGKIVGVNVMIISGPSQGAFAGIALSIDSTVAERAIKTLITEGKIIRPLMGVLLEYEDDTYRIRVLTVVEDSPAEIAGMLEGDIYLELAGIPVNNIDDVFDILATKKPYNTINVKVLRDGVEKLIYVTLGVSDPDWKPEQTED